MSDLRAIAYVSSATSRMTVSELEALLVEARRLNLQRSVTGVLLYNYGNFMQYFEGAEQAVSITYERIRSSRRHKGIIELLRKVCKTSRQSDWHET